MRYKLSYRLTEKPVLADDVGDNKLKLTAAKFIGQA